MNGIYPHTPYFFSPKTIKFIPKSIEWYPVFMNFFQHISWTNRYRISLLLLNLEGHWTVVSIIYSKILTSGFLFRIQQSRDFWKQSTNGQFGFITEHDTLWASLLVQCNSAYINNKHYVIVYHYTGQNPSKYGTSAYTATFI